MVAVHFAVAAQAQDVGVFDLPEIVFGLGIGEAEHHVLVGRAVDVRHAAGVAIDRDALGQSRGFGRFGSAPAELRRLDGRGVDCRRRTPRQSARATAAQAATRARRRPTRIRPHCERGNPMLQHSSPSRQPHEPLVRTVTIIADTRDCGKR